MPQSAWSGPQRQTVRALSGAPVASSAGVAAADCMMSKRSILYLSDHGHTHIKPSHPLTSTLVQLADPDLHTDRTLGTKNQDFQSVCDDNQRIDHCFRNVDDG